MNSLSYTKLHTSSYVSYHVPLPYSLADLSVFDCLPALPSEAADEISSFLWRFGLQNNALREYAIVYPLLVQWLAGNGLAKLVHFGTANETSLFSEKAPSVLWYCHCLQYTQDEPNAQDFGLCTVEEFLTSANYFEKQALGRAFLALDICPDELPGKAEDGEMPAAFFPFLKTYTHDVSHWHFAFFDSELKAQQWEQALQRTSPRPNLQEALGYSRLECHVQVGGDEGYLDGIVLHSLDEIPDIQHLVSRIADFCAEYRNALQEMGTDALAFAPSLYADVFLSLLKKYMLSSTC